MYFLSAHSVLSTLAIISMKLLFPPKYRHSKTSNTCVCGKRHLLSDFLSSFKFSNYVLTPQKQTYLPVRILPLKNRDTNHYEGNNRAKLSQLLLQKLRTGLHQFKALIQVRSPRGSIPVTIEIYRNGQKLTNCPLTGVDPLPFICANTRALLILTSATPSFSCPLVGGGTEDQNEQEKRQQAGKRSP